MSHSTTHHNTDTSADAGVLPARSGSDRGERPRVHQVLATLGYGDAIGHEVIGIRRVLRQEGYESEIFVETADPSLENLTVDYREMVGHVSDPAGWC
jgi:hypothetical protein